MSSYSLVDKYSIIFRHRNLFSLSPCPDHLPASQLMWAGIRLYGRKAAKNENYHSSTAIENKKSLRAMNTLTLIYIYIHTHTHTHTHTQSALDIAPFLSLPFMSVNRNTARKVISVDFHWRSVMVALHRAVFVYK